MDLDVRVQPRAKRNRVEAVEGGRLKLYVTAAPEGGKANEAAIALLAKTLGVPKSSVSIVKGHRSRDKRLSIDDARADAALTRLSAGRDE